MKIAPQPARRIEGWLMIAKQKGAIGDYFAG
jgi:hypothetical protein